MQYMNITSVLSDLGVKTSDQVENAAEENRIIDNSPRFYQKIDSGLNVILYPHILHEDVANRLLKLLLKIEYRSDEDSMVTIMGKKHIIPRKQTAIGAKGVKYSFSGRSVEVEDWDAKYSNPYFQEACEIIRFIASILGDKYGTVFNYALINKYPDNESKIGYHSDDERELGNRPLILGLSLGQEREIHFKPNHSELKPTKISLPNNSLLEMSYPTNTFYKHSIPPSKIKMGPRVSLTFRSIQSILD